MLAIDLGSNTLRVLAYDCEKEESVWAFEKVVKTADGLAEFAVIKEEAISRVIAALNEAKAQIDFTSHTIKAVTTEAIRRAKNADTVLREIEKETGVVFEIISGEEEASLTLCAVKNRLKKLKYISETFVLVDIGGGSTEIIFHYGEERLSRSFPVGIVTIAQTYETLENIQQALPDEMLEMQRFCAKIIMTKGKPNSFVATAGTPTTVAAMKMGFNYETYNANKINGCLLEKVELDFYLKKLLAMPFEEREIAVGTGRSDLIAAGILIYKEIYQIVAFDRCIVIDDGLREGVALTYCKTLPNRFSK